MLDEILEMSLNSNFGLSPMDFISLPLVHDSICEAEEKDSKKDENTNKESTTSKIRKFRWTQEEDNMLKKAVDRKGPKNWEVISECVPGRSAKQCRERWIIRFDKKYNHSVWTPEEDEQLISFQKQFGNKFSRITKKMNSRSPIQVKNRWKYLKKHKLVMSNDADDSVFDFWTEDSEMLLNESLC